MQILNKKRVLIIPKTLKMQAVNIYLFDCIVKCYQNNVTSLLTERPKMQWQTRSGAQQRCLQWKLSKDDVYEWNFATFTKFPS